MDAFTSRSAFGAVPLIVLLSLLASPAVASSDSDDRIESEAAEQEQEEDAPGVRAQEYFDQGSRLYIEEDYTGAIIEFRKAHQLAPHPILLHNIALSNHRLGRTEEARTAAVEAEQMGADLPPESASRNRAMIVGGSTVVQAEAAASSVRIAGAAAGDTEEVSVSDSLFWTGIGAAGLGIGALAGASYINFEIQRHSNELEAAADRLSREDFAAEADEIARWQNRGKALLFSGAGLTAAGIALTAAFWPETGGDEEPGIVVAPAVDEPGMNVMYRW